MVKSLNKLLKKRNKLLDELERLDYEIDECDQLHLLNERAGYIEQLHKLQKDIKTAMVKELEHMR